MNLLRYDLTPPRHRADILRALHVIMQKNKLDICQKASTWSQTAMYCWCKSISGWRFQPVPRIWGSIHDHHSEYIDGKSSDIWYLKPPPSGHLHHFTACCHFSWIPESIIKHQPLYFWSTFFDLSPWRANSASPSSSAWEFWCQKWRPRICSWWHVGETSRYSRDSGNNCRTSHCLICAP